MPATHPTIFVDHADMLPPIVELLLKQDYITIDTEFVRDSSFFSQLCLLQISGPKLPAYCVDTLRISTEDIKNMVVLPLIFQSTLTKVFHACSQDLEILHRLAGLYDTPITPIFDTSIAHQFLSTKRTVSYKVLVQEMLGVTLEQSQTLSDWTYRPLSKSQIFYAANDVSYLCEAYEAIIERLGDRVRWAKEVSAAEATNASKKPQIHKGITSVKKLGGCNINKPLHHKKAYQVAAWREVLAAKENVPRRWTLTDEQVVSMGLQLAYIEEKEKPMMVYFDYFHKYSPFRDWSNEDLTQAFSDFLKQGELLPYEQYIEQSRLIKAKQKYNFFASPQFRKERDDLVVMFFDTINIVSEKLQIATTMLCTRSQVADYLAGDDSMMNTFRTECIGKLLSDLRISHERIVEKYVAKVEAKEQTSTKKRKNGSDDEGKEPTKKKKT